MFEHYIEWEISRMNCITKYIKDNFLNSKSLLELGCYYANNGNNFYNKGCYVTSSDIRENHINIARTKYPHLTYEIFDAEKDRINKKYDIILHYSLLNHITNVNEHLNDVCNNCDYIFLELEIADSIYDEFCIFNFAEGGDDQSYYNKGSRPSANYIEQILSNNNFKFKIIKDSILNTNNHIYDWPINQTNTYNLGQNRFWICWRDGVECPIKDNYVENTTIILQGCINREVDVFNTIANYQNYGQVILSIYIDLEDMNTIIKIANNFPSIHIINNNFIQYKNDLVNMNKYESIPYLDNCYYQIRSTKKSLQKVISNYVVKTRIDHYYGSMGDFIRLGIDQNKIISSSVFVRGVDYARYHLSDHLFCARTNDMKNIFDLALQNYSPGCPEINIWKPFIFYKASLENINLDMLDNNSYADWMAKMFYVYCINRHSNYKLRYQNNIVTSLNDRDKTHNDSKEYFLLGCDC